MRDVECGGRAAALMCVKSSGMAAALQMIFVATAFASRGAVAFHYARSATPAQLAWLARFDVVVTHDPLPRDEVAFLHARGARLALYTWSVAFYGTLAGDWEKHLPPDALLNTRGLRGGAGSATAEAFYFDPASPEHERERPRVLAQRLRAIGYDGVFLDTTTAENVHPEALAEYRRRHPDLPYDRAYARFLRNLRRELRHGVILTNQGYRDAADYLPYADYDVSESLITRPVAGVYRMRPWNDPADPWNSIDYLMRHVIAPAARRYRRVRFIHLNYLDRLDPKSVARIVAIARRYGGDAFVAQPDVTSAQELDDVYFTGFVRRHRR